jgi:2-oxo-4-hydroxy-4-carboxy-5-ureidoimidazoline decarboxylase
VSTLDAFNQQPLSDALHQLLGICGCRRWAEHVAGLRPFRDVAALRSAADTALDTLTDDDWQEALRAEPDPDIAGTDDGTRAAAETAVRLYRQRFGYPFVAAGRRMAADELLMRVRIRLGNDPEVELRTAADELRRGVRARLQRWADGDGGARPA